MSRALRALSSSYVERRGALARGAALDGAGKRAAFALFYGPLHYLLIKEIVEAVARLKPRAPEIRTIIDLGCGTGVAGAAWASACARPPAIIGVDKHPWAVGEAEDTYRALQMNARVRRDDLSRLPPAKPPAGIIAAYSVNELADEARAALLTRLLDRARRGDRVLIVEPLARGIAPWWNEWRDAFASIGGRGDEWRFPAALPPIVAKLDRAAGLDHSELTGRSLWAGRAGGAGGAGG